VIIFKWIVHLPNNFPVGEDEVVSIKEVADAIVKAVGFEGERVVCIVCLIPDHPRSHLFQFDASRSDGQLRKPASNAKLLRLMGGFEFTPFDEGSSLLPLDDK
jgi:GDP-L-fucose synthase